MNLTPPNPDAAFAEPIFFGKRMFFRLSDLLRYEAEVAGEPIPPPLDPADERYFTAKQVRDRYGGASPMWLFRRRTKAEGREGAEAQGG